MTVTLITSAAYISDELAAEFGLLPPSFLPVGHSRLYDLQVGLLGAGCYLTLPESFDLPEADAIRLDGLNVRVITVPDGLSLGASVLHALEIIGDTAAVRILHGDTVIHDLPTGSDVLATGDTPEAYAWGQVAQDDDILSDEVLAGYFAFADGLEFRRCLAMARGDFVAAIGRYGGVRPLRSHKVASWLDCGHLQTYYRSRCAMRIQRSFNDLAMSFQMVEKRSTDAVKLAAEAAWFEALPAGLRLHIPAFLGRSGDDAAPAYALEYLPCPSLHELFVFGDISSRVWHRIIEGIFTYLASAYAASPRGLRQPVIHRLTTDKTEARLRDYLHTTGLAEDHHWRYAGRAMPPLLEIARQTAALIDMDTPEMLGIMHGDLCFTNMFYDYRTQRIKLIDPRGTIDGQTPTILGDLRYDMAKLNHSVAGAYDFILAGRYRCDGFAQGDMVISFPCQAAFERVNALAGAFDVCGRRLNDTEITAITIHLFLSMLPLHGDRPERQQAFIANALRLFAERIDI